MRWKLGVEAINLRLRGYLRGLVKLVASTLGVGALVCLSGCGIFTTQTWESTSYKSPNWAESGNILAVKEVVKFERTLISESSTGGYSVIVEMGPNGENEYELFKISGSETVQVVERSASGNVVAYINDSRYLNVYQKKSGNWVQLWKKTIDPGIDLVKISPDEAKVYASYGLSAFYIFLIDGTQLWSESFGGGGGFKSNSEIVFNQTNEEIGKTSVFNLLTGSLSEVGPGFAFSKYLVSENAVLYEGGTFNSDYIEKMDLDSQLVSTVNFTYTPYEYRDFSGRHLSPDGEKMVMGASSVEHRPSGVYILDIGTSEIRRLR